MVPGTFMYGQYDLRKRWLACQRITLVPMVASILGTFVQIPLCYFFMYTLDFGITGLPLATFVKESTLLATTVAYCHCKPEIRKVLQPYGKEALSGWGPYLAVSLPCTVMLCAEWWAFEGLTIMAGNLGV